MIPNNIEHEVSGCNDCPFYSGMKKNHLCRLDYHHEQRKDRLIEKCKLPETPVLIILKTNKQ